MDPIVESAVKGALEAIEKNAPVEFKELNADPKKKAAVVDAARKAANEQVSLAKEFKGLRIEPEEIAQRLKKHLPESRVQMIKEGLTIPTYKLALSEEGGNFHVKITRDGREFMPSKVLNTLSTVQETTWIQYASIIVEAVLLVMSAVGIHAEVNGKVIAKTAEEVVSVVEHSSLLQKALQNLEKAFHDGSAWDKAKAIFYLIKDSYSAGILWTIIKSLCSNMSTWDWIKTSGVVTAMIIAALATDGAALIAKIVLALNDAYNFVQKVLNLNQLSSIKKTL